MCESDDPLQVEALARELAEVQQHAVGRASLAAAEQAQRDAETRAEAQALEREGMAREVEEMQTALVDLQRQAAAEGAAQKKLARLKATLEDVRSQKAQVGVGLLAMGLCKQSRWGGESAGTGVCGARGRW